MNHKQPVKMTEIITLDIGVPLTHVGANTFSVKVPTQAEIDDALKNGTATIKRIPKSEADEERVR